MPNEFPFFKFQALGSDYLVLDPTLASFEMTPRFAQALCDRRHGIGSDGILLGVTETFVSASVSSVVRDVFSFSLLVVLLMVMPTGLFGRFLEEKV